MCVCVRDRIVSRAPALPRPAPPGLTRAQLHLRHCLLAPFFCRVGRDTSGGALSRRVVAQMRERGAARLQFVGGDAALVAMRALLGARDDIMYAPKPDSVHAGQRGMYTHGLLARSDAAQGGAGDVMVEVFTLTLVKTKDAELMDRPPASGASGTARQGRGAVADAGAPARSGRAAAGWQPRRAGGEGQQAAPAAAAAPATAPVAALAAAAPAVPAAAPVAAPAAAPPAVAAAPQPAAAAPAAAAPAAAVEDMVSVPRKEWEMMQAQVAVMTAQHRELMGLLVGKLQAEEGAGKQ